MQKQFYSAQYTNSWFDFDTKHFLKIILFEYFHFLLLRCISKQSGYTISWVLTIEKRGTGSNAVKYRLVCNVWLQRYTGLMFWKQERRWKGLKRNNLLFFNQAFMWHCRYYLVKKKIFFLYCSCRAVFSRHFWGRSMGESGTTVPLW